MRKSCRYTFLPWTLATVWLFAGQAGGQTNKNPATPRSDGCSYSDRFFEDEVWGKVGERTCLKCHRADGDASDSGFLLNKNSPAANLGAFLQVAVKKKDGKSLLLQKVVGDLDHGGGKVVKKDSTGYRILERLVSRVSSGKDAVPPLTKIDAETFFRDVKMIPPQRLLRRVTLSLAGRLPSDDERSAVKSKGVAAIDKVMENLLQEEAFYVRLKEAFNDILLTNGYDGGGEAALSYTHFHKSRLWYQKRDPNRDRPKDNKLKYTHPEMRAYYQLVKDYRNAMLQEPLELVAYIVRNDRPFAEFATADYIMVSPYTARGYGIFEDIKDQFANPDDPFEFIRTQIKALTDDANGKTVQESKDGNYPHAGILSTFQYLKRYPTTETNRNRLRVRMYFEHFLGIDILQLAPRVGDASAVAAKYETPTMQAPECVVCHRIIDPIAGLFQDYYALDGNGIFGPRREGWYADMFPPGLVNQEIKPDEKWRALPWLGEQTVKDPRFATAMVGHVWYTLTGRSPISPPEDIEDPTFAAKRRAYLVQQLEFQRVADLFVNSKFNLKVVFKELVKTNFYRADGMNSPVTESCRLAEMDEMGLARLLTPELLERKLGAIFGKPWGRLLDSESKLGILYGGIDSKEITERNTEPSGAMGAIQRMMANDMACRHVATDFVLPRKERRLFPGIEPDDVPGEVAADKKIRQAIVHLHQLILGREDKLDSEEVDRTFELFTGIVQDAKSRKGIDPRESYSCQSGREVTPRDKDPHYTIRAWRAVVTYLLRQYEFLYE